MQLLFPILLPLLHSTTTPSHTLIAFGDWGHAENVDLVDRINQYLISHQVDGVMLLGDNFYPAGINPELGVDDPQFELFSDHLARKLEMPFFVVLGNHDYMQNGQTAQIEYKHPWWVMEEGNFFVLFPLTEKTHACVWFVDSIRFTRSNHFGLLRSIIEESPNCTWKILATHYPVITAGLYREEATVGEFREKISCLTCRFDLVISGHEHSSQVLRDRDLGNALFLIAGASTQTYSQTLHHEDPRLVWGNDESSGVILRLSIGETSIQFEFVRLEPNDTETVLFKQTVSKAMSQPVCPHTCV